MDLITPPANGILTLDALARLDGLAHGVTTRRFSDGRLDRHALLQRAAAALRIEPRLIACARQAHGSHIEIAAADKTRGGFFEFSATDAILAEETGVLIAVFTADCVPLLIVDRSAPRIAVVHAGWRGTLGRITEQTIGRLIERGSRPEELRIAIGPAIRQADYEVSEELAARFRRVFAQCPEAVQGRRLDLPELNAHQARASGVPADRISDCGWSTFQQAELLASYRRDGERAGRMASFLMLTDDAD